MQFFFNEIESLKNLHYHTHTFYRIPFSCVQNEYSSKVVAHFSLFSFLFPLRTPMMKRTDIANILLYSIEWFWLNIWHVDLFASFIIDLYQSLHHYWYSLSLFCKSYEKRIEIKIELVGMTMEIDISIEISHHYYVRQALTFLQLPGLSGFW